MKDARFASSKLKHILRTQIFKYMIEHLKTITLGLKKKKTVTKYITISYSSPSVH